MKHFNLLAIGILSLLLVGCSYNANEATSAVSSQMASDDIVTPSTAEHKLSLCVPSSEQGMYTVDSIANGYGNIFYIDFETMQQIPLCDTPNCTHSNDSCTAWLQIDESGFLPGILQLGNSILLVQNGESSNHPACIWIADANGENKKLLFSAQSGQSIGPAFYTDETNSSLYFVLSEVSESSGGITEKKTLSKLDLKTAKIVPLMDITDCGLYSACGDCFIVYQANEREQHFYYLYPGYDTAAILASTPFYSNETSKTGAFVSVDTLFEYDYQTASLKMRNLLTGEEKCFDCSPYAEQPDDEHRPDCRGPYGKYLLYETSYVSKEGYFLPHYRVLNLENGEFSEEMNLKDSQGNFLTSLTVVKDQFCVVYDYTSVNIAVADDNTMENVLIPKYALLSQDDYFHSRDNFHPISNDSF